MFLFTHHYFSLLNDSHKSNRFQQLLNQVVESSYAEDPNDNILYLITNEGCTGETLAIAKDEPIHGEVVLSVSGMFGLNLASVRGQNTGNPKAIQYLIFIDISERVEKFWEGMKEIIKQSVTKEQAISKIEKFLTNNKKHLFEINQVSNYSHYLLKLKKEIAKGKSWLSTDQNFIRIKNIFDRDHFIFKRINLLDEAAMQSLAQAVVKLGCKFDTVYLSNVREYAEEDDFKHATHNHLKAFRVAIHILQTVSTEQTLFIDTKPKDWGLVMNRHKTQQRVNRNSTQVDLVNALSAPSALIPSL
jgi:hypothetical protein